MRCARYNFSRDGNVEMVDERPAKRRGSVFQCRQALVESRLQASNEHDGHGRR
jgi:hypothetical protein